MKQWFRIFLLGLTVVVLTACGSGDNGVDNNKTGNSSTPTSQKTTITGYAEDDPMPNAEVKVTDKDNNIIAQATADVNGKYSLEGEFEDGKVYTLESKGKIADKNVTLHSIFKFSNDTVINANPITELKYQLVQSGKSIDEAESLIREYFSIVSGEKLEQNRFDTQDSVAIGMSDLAKLYDGKLPVDAIGKIKEDILRNASLETKDYSYRSMMQKKIELQSSSNSVKVGQDVNVTILGIDNLNKNYMIRWSGFEGSQSEENKTNVSFTVSVPQDVYVKATIYKKMDTNSTLFVQDSLIVVHFKKELKTYEINTTSYINADINITFPDDSSGNLYTFQEVINPEKKVIKHIKLGPSGSTFSTPVILQLKYDPTRVIYPSKIVLKRTSGEIVDYLSPESIDYDNHIITFKTSHFSEFEYSRIADIWWVKDSLESWDEDYVEGFKPYDYLKESIDKYCSELIEENDKCEKIKEIFKSWDDAEDYHSALSTFFNKEVGGDITNYDIFTNDFMIWNYAKKIAIPLDSSNMYNSQREGYPGNLEHYRNAVRFLLAKDIEGNARKLNFFSNTELSYEVNDIFNDNKVIDFVKKQTIKLIIGKGLGNIIETSNLGLLIDAVNMLDISFKDMRSISLASSDAVAGNNPDCLFAVAIKSINYADAYECSYSYSIDDIDNDGNLELYENGNLITESKAKDIVKQIIVDESRLEGKEREFLVQYYLIYQAINILKQSNERKEILNELLKRGAIAAVSIAKEAGILDEDDIKVPMDELDYSDSIFIDDYDFDRSINRSIYRAVEVKTIDSIDQFANLALRIPTDKFNDFKLKKVSLEGEVSSLEKPSENEIYNIINKDRKEISIATFDESNWEVENNSTIYKFKNLFPELLIDTQNKLYRLKINVLYFYKGKEYTASKDYVFSIISDDNNLETSLSRIHSHVVDARTREPIPNVTIYIDPVYFTALTDENGNYNFSNLVPGRYRLDFMMDGYKTTSQYVTIESNQTINLEVSMIIDEDNAITTGGAKITLKDALNGNIITNGYIKVREGQNNKDGEVLYQVTNDGNSSVNLELMPNVYTVEVGANGYSKSFNTITIIGDTNSTYEFTVSPVLPEDQMRIVLTWGENPSDLDSHLVRLSGNSVDYHVYYSNMRPANADASLDTDDTSSYGPETITISGLDANKTYKYYVHDFSNRSDHNDTALKSSGAKVEVYYGDQSKTFYVPNENGNAWKVFEIVNGEIVPCTTACMFGVDGSGDSNIGLRKLDRNALDKRYFRNLPAK